MLAPVPTLTFLGLYSESNRIIKCHSRHFRTLSAVFLFPLSLSLLLYPTFRSLSLSLPATAATITSLSLSLVYAIFLYAIFLSAISTITFSAYRASNNKPVSFLSCIASLSRSFLPLFSTTLASVIVLTTVCLIFVLFAGIVHKFIKTLGVQIDYNSDYFHGSILFLSIVCGLVLIYCQANWTLAAAIVVAESKWGFQPLWRSACLLRGTKSIPLSKFLYFGLIIGFTAWANSTTLPYQRLNWWRILGFVLQIVLGSTFVTFFMLQNVVANTVLYVHCMALHGELLFTIDEEFAPDYLSFPLIINEP